MSDHCPHGVNIQRGPCLSCADLDRLPRSQIQADLVHWQREVRELRAALSERSRAEYLSAIAAERAAVVAWLRNADHEVIVEALAKGTWWIDDVLNAAADAIERGEHLEREGK